MRDLVIAGALAGGKEAALVAAAMNEASKGEPWRILGYVDDNAVLHGEHLYGHRVLGALEDVARELSGTSPFFACVIGSNEARERVVTRALSFGWRAATLIHPSAAIADRCEIGDGTYIAAQAVISADATIGRFVLINYGASVGHDAVLDDFSQAAPGARLNGNCRLHARAFVGSNAVLVERVEVGEGARVGACAAVLESVEANSTVVGVPARRVR